MRISDWSSDVCSSDLPDGERAVGVRRRPGSGRGTARVAAETGQAHGQPGQIWCDAGSARACRTTGRAAAEDRFPVDRHQRRSEEHTSELQSLMRISYAVFCLKKNKREYKHEHIVGQL